MPKLSPRALALSLSLAGMALFGPAANAATPLGGLTIAVDPSGKTLVAGGNTRTLVVLDPQSLEVKARHWIGTSIVRLAFNGDGSILAVEDTSGTVFLYDTKTWKAKYTLQKHASMATAPAHNILAGVNSRYRGGTIDFNSMKDGANMGQIQLGPKERVAAMGFSKDGKKLGVLLAADKSPDEKVVKYNDIPKDLRGQARDEFRQLNDGKVSVYRVYEVPSGKQLSEGKTWFDLGHSGQLAFDGDAVVALGYSTYGARIQPDGKTKMFKTKNSYNYGLALSPDGSTWLSGGLANYSLTGVADMGSKGSGRVARLPGWPEYFKGFTATADNKAIYGASTAYRVFKFGPDGKLVKSAPIK
jgi:WD40 repeat protein